MLYSRKFHDVYARFIGSQPTEHTICKQTPTHLYVFEQEQCTNEQNCIRISSHLRAPLRGDPTKPLLLRMVICKYNSINRPVKVVSLPGYHSWGITPGVSLPGYHQHIECACIVKYYAIYTHTNKCMDFFKT
jgi:hypothetical protein